MPLFRPLLGYLDQGEPMPRRTVVATLVVMWLAVAVDASIVGLGGTQRPLLAGMIVGPGLVGDVFVVRLGRRRTA